METPEEKNETNLPKNVKDDRYIDDDPLMLPKESFTLDPDQHTSPLKEVLVDDRAKMNIIKMVDGDVYNDIKHHSIQDDCYVFDTNGILFGLEKYASITKALNMINFSIEISINIECVGQGKFRITKN